MPLFFRSGIPFAVGSLPYSYRPESPPLDIPKLFVQVQVDGKEVEALVDTGAQFFICSPAVARYLGLEDADAVGTERLNIRGTIITGALHRVELTLQADEGEGLSLEVTAFVPQATDEGVLGDIPCFLGMFCCLERLRFAIDPSTEMFYFGDIS